MKIIKDYLDSLFLSVPITPETQKAKEDLLAIMEDHFHELVAEGKSEHEAIGAVISEFGSIDELLTELEVEKQSEEDDWDKIEIEDAIDFWEITRKFSFEVSLGIMLLILALAAVATFPNTLGVLLLFVIAVVGLGFIISGVFKYNSGKKLLDDRLIDSDVSREANVQLENYEHSFRMGLILGIGFCVLAIPVAIFFTAVYYSPNLAAGLFFAVAALGVFLIVYTSIIRTGFVKMSQLKYFISDEDAPGPRATRDSYGDAAPFIMALKKVYWPIVTLIYFLWSFIFGGWAYSWLIFVAAGILDSIITETFKQNKK